MEDKTCKTCKWWSGNAALDKAAFCGSPKLSPDQLHVASDGAIDSEEYGGICTGPNFGCIHHESEQ